MTPRLFTLIVAAALIGAPSGAAFAQPEAAQQASSARASPPKPTTASSASRLESDFEQYAEREAKDKAAADFQGGNVLVIGGGTVAVVLLIVLLVVLL
jgi:hypothetical protein